MGWLHATPTKASHPRIKSCGDNPPLPTVPDAAQYMTGLLFEIGPATQSGALTWQELQSYQHLTGKQLSAWEAQTLRNMAISYVNEYNAGREPTRPAPYVKPMESSQMKQVFKSIARSMKNA
jgi:hypothetical protein